MSGAIGKGIRKKAQGIRRRAKSYKAKGMGHGA
jgi:hypothetical protein